MKNRKNLVRAIFIVLGVSILIGTILIDTLNTLDMWHTETFPLKYSSIWECIFARQKFSTVIAFILGSIPIGIGLWITSD